MIEDQLSDLKWHEWTPKAFTALGNLQYGRYIVALPAENEPREEALKLARSFAIYNALRAWCGPDDYDELSRLQQIEYEIYSQVSALHRLGWSFRWASSPEDRTARFMFLPRKRR